MVIDHLFISRLFITDDQLSLLKLFLRSKKNIFGHIFKNSLKKGQEFTDHGQVKRSRSSGLEVPTSNQPVRGGLMNSLFRNFLVVYFYNAIILY